MATILVVDDESTICWGIQRLGERIGHNVLTATSAEAGLEIVAKRPVDLLLLDVRLPGMDGLTAINHFRKRLPNVPIVVMTAFGDVSTAVRALESGAVDYMLKPFDLSEIRGAIERALDFRPGTTATATEPVDGMVGRSPVMQGVFKRLALAAHSDVSVLLIGEKGVGKELAARTMHNHSRRRELPFVPVDVETLSSEAADVLLFGAPGSGRAGDGIHDGGLLAQAAGGTIYIDEVADVPTQVQAKLLRAVEGPDAPATKVRLISSTTSNLEQRLESGQLRADFYFRVSAFPIAIPPLRERDDDVVDLARLFVSQLAPQSPPLSPALLAELRSRVWHGNVHELRSSIEHALVLAHNSAILPEHLPPPQRTSAARGGGSSTGEVATVLTALAEHLLADADVAGNLYERYLAAVEPALLRRVLSRHNGEVAPAARMLGLHRTTLRRKLDQLGIDPRTR